VGEGRKTNKSKKKRRFPCLGTVHRFVSLLWEEKEEERAGKRIGASAFKKRERLKKQKNRKGRCEHELLNRSKILG